MTASPENGSILSILRRLIRKEMVSRASQQARNEKFEEENDKEEKQRATQIQDALSNRTAGDPSREVIPNVSFSTHGLMGHGELGTLVFKVIHAQPTAYHNYEWLKNTLAEFHQFDGEFEYGSTDANSLQTIEERIEKIIKKIRLNTRNVDLEKELEEIKGKPSREKGEELEEREIEKMLKLEQVSWEQAIEDLASTHGSAATKKIQEAVEAMKKAGEEKIEYKAKEKLEDSIEEAKRDIWKKMEAANESFRRARNSKAFQDQMDRLSEQYHDIDRVYGKVARHILDQYPVGEVEEGRLYDQMRGDPVKGKALEKKILDNPDYMDYWFYKIISPVLYNPMLEQHRELFTLYPAADMDLFLEIVRKKVGPDGKRLGLKEAARYTILKNIIFQSHDMDHFCAHPGQEFKDFISSTSLFLNSYIAAGLQDPMVALAKRIYERELLSMRETNKGFIPREWLARWDQGQRRPGKLDDMVVGALGEALKVRQVYGIKMDKATGMPEIDVWGRQQHADRAYKEEEFYGHQPSGSTEWERELGDYKIAAAAKQAKGLSLVDQRMLEIIAKSLGTGGVTYNDPDKKGVDGIRRTIDAFNSVPYENIVRHMEPVIHYFTRFALGHEYYDAFFNMMIAENPKMNSEHMKEIIKLDYAGEYEKMEEYCKEHQLGDLTTRLIQQENPWGYSSMWGTMTKWRNSDMVNSFDDWELDQGLSAANKIAVIGDRFYDKKNSFQVGEKTWAQKKVKKYLTEGENDPSKPKVYQAYQAYQSYRKEFRDQLKQYGTFKEREMAVRDEATHGMDDEFELYWRAVGMDQKIIGGGKTYKELFEGKWEEYFKKFPDGHKELDKKKDAYKLICKLERAYKSRVWVQTTMRSPLIVARELYVERVNMGAKERVPLRNKIIKELLPDIELREFKKFGTPDQRDEARFNKIVEIERAVGNASEIAIRENRDLRAKDFDDIIEQLEGQDLQGNYKKAKEYWIKVKNAMLGEHRTAEYIYEALGIKDARDDRARGLRFHDIDWNKINAINLDDKRDRNKFILGDSFKTELLNNSTIDRVWRHLFSTEDMGWEYLNLNVLGERNPIRRAHDLGDHVGFGQEFEKYLVNLIVGTPDLDKLKDQLKLMSNALAGDYYDVAVEACGKIIYTTGMMYRKEDIAWRWGPVSLVWNLFNDASIVETIRTRQRGSSMGPNELMAFSHKVVGASIIPSSRYSRMGGRELAPFSEWNGSVLEKRWGSSRFNAVWEIGAWAPFWAWLLQLVRAFQAKSEEEET